MDRSSELITQPTIDIHVSGHISGTAAISVVADICRDELLFEMDAAAAFAS